MKSILNWRDPLLVLVTVILVMVCAWQIVDYTHFRQAGARFTASDGVELCASHHNLAEFAGYPGPLPACDYPSRQR